MILAKRGATLVAEVARLPPDDAEGNRLDVQDVIWNGRQKKSKLVKYPYKYSCSKCGGDLVSSKN
jgi:hypothetical protein